MSVRCPKCNHEWEEGCEQEVAIRKRGKCIGCVVDAKERIEMEPYEFAVQPKEATPCV